MTPFGSLCLTFALLVGEGEAGEYEQAPALEDPKVDGTASEVLSQPEAAPTAASNLVNGYLDSRLTFQRANVAGLLPTRDLAQLVELIELNVQLKHIYAASGFVYGDMSAFGQVAGLYRTQDPQGKEVDVADHPVAQYLPLFSLNEFYLSQDLSPQLNLMVGKKRLVWGPGLAFNPTDILDPPKDPTNPSFQRAGFWMGRLEANLGDYAFTLLAAPQVTEQAVGLPYGFVKYPDWDRRDTASHYQLAARVYAGVANADLNLMLFYGNRYNDAFGDKLRVGASFARYFFTDYELHAEILLQTGSAQNYPDGACLQSEQTALQCVRGKTPLVGQTRLTDTAVLPHLIVGTRRVFGDESSLSLEYYFQADGYTKAEFQNFVYLLELQGLGAAGASSPSGGGIPQNFTFNPTGRNYLFLSYSKPKIFEDWTAGAVVIASLDDLSTFISPSIAWSVRDWLTLSLFGFIPTPGANSMAAVTTTGKHVSQFTVGNSYFRVLWEARVFY